MPLYYFQEKEPNNSTRDLDALQLASDDDAWEEAIISCSERIKDFGAGMPKDGDFAMIVMREDRALLFTIRLSTRSHPPEN